MIDRSQGRPQQQVTAEGSRAAEGTQETAKQRREQRAEGREQSGPAGRRETPEDRREREWREKWPI